MTRILVPIDGSKPSLRAIEYLFKRHQRGEQFEVIIITTLPAITPDRYVSRNLINKSRRTEAQMIFALRPVQQAVNLLAAKTKILVGEPSEKIVAFAKRARCSEIVMGTRGLGAVRGMILGSVANKVIHLSSIPVTLVH